MNILLINHFAGSPRLGMEYRPHQMAARWQAAGHQVTVLAADHSHLRLHNPKISRSFEERRVDGVPYCFVRTPDYDQNIAGRGRNAFAFVWALWRHARQLAQRYRPDVVIASSTYPFDSYPAKKIADMAGAGLVFEIHDLWPLTQIELYGYREGHPMVRAIALAESYAYRNADGVVSILPGGARYFAEQGQNGDKCTYIPNGVEEAPAKKKAPAHHLAELERLRRELGFVLLYCGSLGKSNALEVLIRVADRLEGKAAVVLIGNGPYKIYLRRAAERRGLTNLVFLEGVERSQVGELLAAADALYVGAKASRLYDYGISMNKIFDYMQAGRPVLCAMAAANDPVGEAGCGLTVAPDNPDALAAGVLELKTMTPDRRRQLGAKGQAYVAEHHSCDKLAKEFLAVLERAAEAGANRAREARQ